MKPDHILGVNFCIHCGGVVRPKNDDVKEFDYYGYYCMQAKTCSIKGDHISAIKFYKEALKSTVMDYGKWDVFCAIAGEYEVMEDYTSAEWYWNKCSELEESGSSINTPRRIAKRADFLYRRDRLDEASEYMKKH